MIWFLKSIGVADEVLEHLDQVALAFQRPVVLWGGLLFLLPIGYFIYRRQQANLATVPHKFRVALSVTRILILMILIGVLAGPYLKLDHEIIKRPIVALLLDVSQSMQLPAGPYASDDEVRHVAAAAGRDVSKGELDAEARKSLDGLKRVELAKAAITSAHTDFLQPLEKDYEVRYYTFARETIPWAYGGTEEGGTAEGRAASHLGESILHVLDEAAGRHVAGILLFSDGQSTGGRSTSQASRIAAEAGTPIFVAPLGSSQRMADVAVVDVYTSGLVSLGDTVHVHVTLESQGFDGKPVTVELKEGDEVLDKKEAIVQGAEQQQVELTFEAKRAGMRYLTVNVPALPEEAAELRSNNTDATAVRISDEKLRVLFVDGHARWDFRFLKNALRRDHGLKGRTADVADVLLEAEWKRLPEEARGSALPRTGEELGEYHTIILGDASPDLLGDEFQKGLQVAVRERGVGLIVAAGTQSMPHRFGADFQELLPVQLGTQGAGLEAPVYQPFRLEVSAAGSIHETMRLYDDPGRNQDTWDRLPPYYWCASAERPSAAATVLAWNPGVEGRFGKMPLIAHQYVGEGKVLFVGTDATWLWRQNVGDRYFYKFWGQCVRFVARRNEEAGKKSSIELRPVRAQPGERAEIELMAFRPDGKPDEHPTQSIAVLGPGGRSTVELVADKAKPGRFTGTFVPEEAGIHRAVYQPEGQSPTEATLQVLVAPEEYRHPNLNRPALEQLAHATQGKVIALDEIKSIGDQLTGEKELQQLHREATLWDNWLTLVVLILVYSVDVGMRRLMGLA